MFRHLIFIFCFVFLSCSSITETSIEVRHSKDLDTVQKIQKHVVSENKELSNPNSKVKIDFITIGKLDIMKTDLGFFDSKQAEIACNKLGDGWRLPNEVELNVIFEQNEKLGTFKTNYYLGTETGMDAYNEDVTLHLRMSIINGEIVLLQSDQELFSQYGVRAVRDHKP
jgi:hypothetical protein